jgi:hypothetical protein
MKCGIDCDLWWRPLGIDCRPLTPHNTGRWCRLCHTWRQSFTAWDTWFPLILALDVLVVDGNDYETGYDDADSAEIKEVPVT